MNPKPEPSWWDRLFGPDPPEPPEPPGPHIAEPPKEVTLRPALRRIGIVDCPICNHEVSVFLTKTNRPYVNCGFCSTRIFYNGQEGMRLLKQKMRVVADE